MAQFNKQSVLTNWKYAVLAGRDSHWQFIKDDEELERWLTDGSIHDGDVVLELTEATVRVAQLKNFIELI